MPRINTAFKRVKFDNFQSRSVWSLHLNKGGRGLYKLYFEAEQYELITDTLCREFQMSRVEPETRMDDPVSFLNDA